MYAEILKTVVFLEKKKKKKRHALDCITELDFQPSQEG